jgi:hypothetical protein
MSIVILHILSIYLSHNKLSAKRYSFEAFQILSFSVMLWFRFSYLLFIYQYTQQLLQIIYIYKTLFFSSSTSFEFKHSSSGIILLT